MSADRRDEPLVSVGFPVFNEEAFLPEALDSILAQDYEHLEVIVCDNASTDATLEIARDYAARDARITVYENDANRGAAVNFNRCFQFASGQYFTWASGHDTRLPQAIRKCVEALEGDLRLVLCYPRTLFRYPDGSSHPDDHGSVETRGLPPALRLRKTIEDLRACNEIHGVIRSEALARTRLCRHCFAADTVLLAELSLLGDFHRLDETLFVRLENRAPEEFSQRLERVLTMLDVRTPLRRSWPFTVKGIEHVRGAWYVSEGPAKATNAGLAGFWFTRRSWQAQLEPEWHLTKPGRAARAVLKTVRPARIVLPGRTIGRTPAGALGYIDGVTLDGAMCAIEGWATDSEGRPLAAHGVRIGDVPVGGAHFERTSRPDVRAVFQGIDDSYGFRATFSLLETRPTDLKDSTLTVGFRDSELTAEWPNALVLRAARRARWRSSLGWTRSRRSRV